MYKTEAEYIQEIEDLKIENKELREGIAAGVRYIAGKSGKIGAIKLYRFIYRSSLMKAKAFVDTVYFFFICFFLVMNIFSFFPRRKVLTLLFFRNEYSNTEGIRIY